jgi:glucose-6-phosphate isomerase
VVTQDLELWERLCRYRVSDDELGFSIDVSRVRFDEAYLEEMAPVMTRALGAMEALEKGAVANRDEDRMVGHYWLRDPERAPSRELGDAIRDALGSIHAFSRAVHGGEVHGEGGAFRHLLHIGIGGSALGPQLVSQALGTAQDRLRLHFLDNTDPGGIDDILAGLGPELGRTLVSVASKSGGTPEPRNGMLEAQAAYGRAGLDFARHAVAITMEGSRLDVTAVQEGWLRRFPMWDWVGGRTSVMSAVGLVPAALQGIDVDAFLGGAAAMDALNRRTDVRQNPAALLALMWHRVGNGRGEKDMVILPYKDRLMMLSRYLQQLVMESLGKERDRRGDVVHQGIAVYGNKGSTDQHAYLQQLREGLPNFFATFLQVRNDRDGSSLEVDPGITSGDYLCGFLLGTRRALHENERDSITLSVEKVTPRSVGALIALYERAVGLYAELVDVNAYHQPGVEAGKAAAAAVLELQPLVVAALKEEGGARTAAEIAEAVGRPEEV